MAAIGRRAARRAAVLLGAAALAMPGAASGDAAAPASAPVERPRLIVLTDVGSDPDDMESLVRLLVYANEIDIEGLAATTSNHMRSETHRDMIEAQIRAYGQALPNLKIHAAGYPEASTLLARVRDARPLWGTSQVGAGKDSEASRMIVAAVDRPDPRPVWINIWGGARELAQALWSVRATRTAAQLARFVAKLRVYSISDQDDAGPWARQNFPELFWITSIHAFGDYALGAFTGIASATPGADASLVRKPWLAANVRGKGPLGAAYPLPQYSMEGDTPAFLYLIPNGLGSPEHPDWGSWGGRYGKLSPAYGLWTDAPDAVTGQDGKRYSDAQATIWRWRGAFQNDFVARMDWSVSRTFAAANHRPQLRLNGTAGATALRFAVCPGGEVALSAAGSTDLDGQPLTYRWWRYAEPTGHYPVPVKLAVAEGVETRVAIGAPSAAKQVPVVADYLVHIILEVRDSGTPALTSYRRAVIAVPDPRSPAGRACAAKVG